MMDPLSLIYESEIVGNSKTQQYIQSIFDSLVPSTQEGYFRYNGSIYLKNQNMKKLPDFSNVFVDGNFDCSENDLISLEGAPCFVSDGFDCSFCEIKSLAHAPKYIGKYFDFSHNRVVSLGSIDMTDEPIARSNIYGAIYTGGNLLSKKIPETFYGPELPKWIEFEKMIGKYGEENGTTLNDL